MCVPCYNLIVMGIVYDNTEEKTDLQKRIQLELEEKRQRAALRQANKGATDDADDNRATRTSIMPIVGIIILAVLVVLGALLVR